MAGLYVNDYRPWPRWVVEGNEEMARKFGMQIGTYHGHADRDPGHDMSGDKAADFFPFDNDKAKHDAVLSWFKKNASRIGATYIITWRRIWSVARADEGTRVYVGSDPHTGHLHVSYGNTPPREQENDMPLNNDDKAWIRKAIKEEVAKVWELDVIPNVWGDAATNPTVQAKSAIKQIGSDTHKP